MDENPDTLAQKCTGKYCFFAITFKLCMVCEGWNLQCLASLILCRFFPWWILVTDQCQVVGSCFDIFCLYFCLSITLEIFWILSPVDLCMCTKFGLDHWGFAM